MSSQDVKKFWLDSVRKSSADLKKFPWDFLNPDVQALKRLAEQTDRADELLMGLTSQELLAGIPRNAVKQQVLANNLAAPALQAFLDEGNARFALDADVTLARNAGVSDIEILAAATLGRLQHFLK